MQVTIAQAAAELSLSTDTVRRRLRIGQLSGTKERHAGGYRWLVDLDDPAGGVAPDRPGLEDGPRRAEPSPPTAPDALQEALQCRIDSLESQVTAKDKQIEQLHVLLSQKALESAPARPWYAFWR